MRALSRPTPATNVSRVTVTYQYAGPALSRAARNGHHHSINHLLDGRPPDVDSKLVGDGAPERRRIRRGRSRDERGATFVLTAICMVLLLWAGAMGVDIGFTVTSSRQAQSLADTAALDLARYINLADSEQERTYLGYLSGRTGQHPIGQQCRQRDVHRHGYVLEHDGTASAGPSPTPPRARGATGRYRREIRPVRLS